MIFEGKGASAASTRGRPPEALFALDLRGGPGLPLPRDTYDEGGDTYVCPPDLAAQTRGGV